MQNLNLRLAEMLLRFAPKEGMNLSPVPGVSCIKFSKPDQRTKRRWRACLGIVAEGAKEIVLGRRVYPFSVGDFTAAPIELPLVTRIVAASPEKPFLGLLIDLEPRVLAEIAAQLPHDEAEKGESQSRALFLGKMNPRLLEAALRVAELFANPEDAPILGPLAIKEALYHLLKTPEGPSICRFVRSGNKTHQVCQAIYSMRSELAAEVDVPALAKVANMSRTAFFKHFKEVTAVSPIQFQKRLRLLEARRLMVEQGETAERSAFQVGYNSPSQFSREYSRMFGKSPRRDVDGFISEKRSLFS